MTDFSVQPSDSGYYFPPERYASGSLMEHLRVLGRAIGSIKIQGILSSRLLQLTGCQVGRFRMLFRCTREQGVAGPFVVPF
jgi:hypothetical protein